MIKNPKTTKKATGNHSPGSNKMAITFAQMKDQYVRRGTFYRSSAQTKSNKSIGGD